MPDTMDTAAPEVETAAPNETQAPVTEAPKSWIDNVSEDYRADPNIAKYKSIDELAKGHLEVVKLVGKKGVIVPQENAPPEEIAKFNKAIGVPDKPEGYKLSIPDKVHPSIASSLQDPNAGGEYKQLAHQLGLTPKQADGLNKWYIDKVSGEMTRKDAADETTRQETETSLRQEWGGEFDTNITLAKKIVEKFGGKDAVGGFGELGNNATVLKTLANIGKKMSEDSLSRGEFNDITTSTSSAKSRLEEVNKRIMALDPKDSDYSKLLKERTKLYELAYPAGEDNG